MFGHFGDIFGHFWPFLAILGPLGKYGCRLVLWPLKMTTREAEIQWRWFRMSLLILSGHFGHFEPFSTILANFGPKIEIVINWSCDHSKWPQEEQKSNGDGFGCHFLDFQAIFGYFWLFLANFRAKLKIVINWSCDQSKWPQEKQKSNWDGFWCRSLDF